MADPSKVQVVVDCRECGRTFHGIVDLDEGHEAHFFCPSCGSEGQPRHGAYALDGVGRTWFTPVEQVLRGALLDQQQKAELVDVVRTAVAQKHDRETIATRLERIPALGPLVKLLPHDRNELYTFLALILTFLQWRGGQATKNRAKRERRAQRATGKRPKA